MLNWWLYNSLISLDFCVIRSSIFFNVESLIWRFIPYNFDIWSFFLILQSNLFDCWLRVDLSRHLLPVCEKRVEKVLERLRNSCSWQNPRDVELSCYEEPEKEEGDNHQTERSLDLLLQMLQLDLLVIIQYLPVKFFDHSLLYPFQYFVLKQAATIVLSLIRHYWIGLLFIWKRFKLIVWRGLLGTRRRWTAFILYVCLIFWHAVVPIFVYSFSKTLLCIRKKWFLKIF